MYGHSTSFSYGTHRPPYKSKTAQPPPPCQANYQTFAVTFNQILLCVSIVNTVKCLLTSWGFAKNQNHLPHY